MSDESSHSAVVAGQQWSRLIPRLTCLLVIAFATAGLSCSRDGTPAEGSFAPSDAGRSKPFSLHVLEDSIYQAGEFGLEIERGSPVTTVEVVGSGAKELKALYLKLDYDPEALVLVSAVGSPALAARGKVLELAVLDTAGVAYHGQVLANWPERDGFSGDGVLARFSFAPASGRPMDAGPRNASAVPVSDRAEHYLNFNAKSCAFFWYYVNPGDYDQNGEVGIADLTPLGANFNDEGPFEVADSRMVIDGDGNGAINIADITPIGANFGNRIDNFTVYGSEDGADYPDSNTAPNGASSRLIGNRPFSAGNGGGALRKYWELAMDQPVIGHANYWLRPASYGDEGTPSQMVTHEQEWHVTDVFAYQPSIEPYDIKGLSLATVSGRPGIVVIVRNVDASTFYHYYLSATDAVGSQWNSPVSATSGSMHHSSPSLAEIDGRPAFCWFEDHVITGLRYMHGTNSNGTAWSAPVTIDSESYAGLGSRLLEFEGKPAAVYTNNGEELCLSLAEDAAGSSWLPKVHISGSTDISVFDAAVLPGGIGTAMEDENTGAVRFNYVEISDGVATVMPGEYLIGDYISSSRSIDLECCGGTPYMATTRSSDNKLHYCFASGAAGGGWSAPAPVALDGIVDKCSGTVAYGVPWACYYDPSAGQLSSGHAVEPASNVWVNEAKVIDTSPGIGYITVGRAAGHPAVAYNDDDQNMIWFAAYY